MNSTTGFSSGGNDSVSAAPVVAWCGPCKAQLPDDALFCPACGMRGEFLKQPQMDKSPQIAQPYSPPVPAREVPAPAGKPAPSVGNKILAYAIFGVIWLVIAMFKAIGRSVAQKGSPTDALDWLLFLAFLSGIFYVIQQICVKNGKS